MEISQSQMKNAAIDLIKHYVLRGDTIQQLKAGQMGSYNGEYSAQIGGYITPGEKHYATDKILVLKIGDQECAGVFSLEQIYQEILMTKTQMSLFG